MRWIKDAMIGAVLLMVLTAIDSTRSYDDSDPPGGRSGFVVMKDNLTGCEYLKTVFGTPVPRLDESGRQLCRRDK